MQEPGKKDERKNMQTDCFVIMWEVKLPMHLHTSSTEFVN